MDNKLAAIQTITQTEDINRKMLANSLGISGAAITKIINPLVENGFLKEADYVSRIRGGKARYLSVRDGKRCVLVIRVVRRGIYGAVVDIAGGLLSKIFVDVALKDISNSIILDLIRTEIQTIPTGMSVLCCVVLTPGVEMKSDTGKSLLGKLAMPFAWNFSILSEEIQKQFGLEMLWENSSNAALLGEIWFGKGKGFSSVVLYSLGEGIGASAYFDGTIHRGFNNSAVEIGHVTINENGPMCPCGNHGCLELYASTMGWEKEYGEKEFRQAFSKARNGDGQALAVVWKYADIASIGALTLATMFTPQRLIITTNEASYIDLELIADRIKNNISNRLYAFDEKHGTRIEVSSQGLAGFLRGAIPIALERSICGHKLFG